MIRSYTNDFEHTNEAAYRKALISTTLFTEVSLPNAIYPAPVPEATTAHSQGNGAAAASSDNGVVARFALCKVDSAEKSSYSSLDDFTTAAPCHTTEEEVYKRLAIPGLMSEVGVKPCVKIMFVQALAPALAGNPQAPNSVPDIHKLPDLDDLMLQTAPTGLNNCAYQVPRVALKLPTAMIRISDPIQDTVFELVLR